MKLYRLVFIMISLWALPANAAQKFYRSDGTIVRYYLENAEAAQLPNINGVLVLNSGSSSFQHDVEYNIKQTVPNDSLEYVLQGFRGFAKQVVESNEPFPVEVSGHGYAFWKDALERDLLAPLAHIKAPVIVMQATNDESVDPVITQQQIESIIKAGATNVQLIMVPDLDHSFRDVNGSSKLTEVVNKAAKLFIREVE